MKWPKLPVWLSVALAGYAVLLIFGVVFWIVKRTWPSLESHTAILVVLVLMAPLGLGLSWKRIRITKLKGPGFEADVLTVKTSTEAPKEITPDRVPVRPTIPSLTAGIEVQAVNISAVTFHPQTDVKPGEIGRGDLRVVTSTQLASAGKQHAASHVGVPSVAMNGSVVLCTGNWYAAFSQDGGHKFRYLDRTALDLPSDQKRLHSFCCNQVVVYAPTIDMFAWILEYGPSTGNNLHRLAFAKTKDLIRGQWRVFDITPQMLGFPGAYLSFPDLAVGANYLYVTTNIYISPGEVPGAVLRIPFASFGKTEVQFDKFLSMHLFSFRVVQNCRETAFFAAHQDTSTLAVFRWPETENIPTQRSVPVPKWLGGNGYSSQCPDGRRWLDRVDPRLTGATMAGHELWFAWPVDKGSNRLSQPSVQVARINSWDMSPIENIHVFDPDSAICYPALSTNADNDIAISYMIGGGPRFPSHVVGTLTNPRKQVLVMAGERGPDPDPNTGAGEWGDYLTVRPVFPERKLFVAAAYTLQGKGDGTRVDATPHCTIFGRSE